jgi:hypothetical protein
MRDRLVAVAVAETLTPKLPAAMRDPIRRTVEAEALPRLRDVWTPDEPFLARLTKPALLSIMAQDLAMSDQAAVLGAAKKSEIVTFLTGLFAAPFATLTEDQRNRVTDWCPTELATPLAPEIGAVDSEVDAESADERDAEDDGADDGSDDEDADEEPAQGDLEAA